MRPVNIIVVTRNNFECISHFTQYVYERTDYPYELIIVDNYSTDVNVVEYLKVVDERDDSTVVRLPTNRFYFPAANLGIINSKSDNTYTILLNDDVEIESANWIQYFVDILESDDRIAYTGDFREHPYCPPLGGWIDGWCMFFRTEVFERVGLFDDQYIWWYGAADYAVRTLKAGYTMANAKRPGDSNSHFKGILRHIGHQTISKVKEDESLPIDQMFVRDFRFEQLLYRHGLYRYFVLAKLKRLSYPLRAYYRTIRPK